MKKLLSVILAFTMICSCCVMPISASAETITEAERQEILNTPDFQYVDLSAVATADVFASYEDAGTYSRFNKSGSGKSGTTNAYSDKYPATKYSHYDEVFETQNAEGETVTIYDWLPISTNIKYEDVVFYKKALNPNEKASVNGVLMIEDLLLPNGTIVSSTQYTGGNNSTAKTALLGTHTHTEVKKRTVNNAHVKEVVTENDKTYAIIENSGIKHKIGPVSADSFTPNAVYMSGTKNVSVNMSGNTLSVLYIMGNLHTNKFTASSAATSAAPLIAIQKIQLYYKGESTPQEKYVFIEYNAEADYNANYITKMPFVSRAVVYAPKNADGTPLTSADFYNSDASKRKVFKYATADNAGEHGIDVEAFDANRDIVFPNDKYMAASKERATVAAVVKQRQGIVSNYYGNTANFINIPLDSNKVLEKVTYKSDYTLNNYDDAMYTGDDSAARQGIIPVEIPSANQDYEYFIFTGSIANTTNVVGMTVVGESLQDRIDAMNAVLTALDSKTLTEADIAGYKAQVAALVAESEYILESDFDISKLTEAEKRIEDEKLAAEKEAALNVRYTTVDTLSLPQDLFATKAEVMSNSNWYNVDSTAAAPNAYAYKGFSQDSSEKKYPNAKFGFAFSIDGLNSLAEISEENGTYTYTLAGVPFKLGTIEEGKVGNNAYIIRTHFDATKTSDDVVVNAPSTTAPAVYTGTSPMNYATYTINKSGISEVNLLMTDVYVKDASDNKLVRAYIKYEGEKEIPVYLIVANAQTSFADKVYVIKKSDYEAIKTNDSLITMKDKDELTLEEYKELIRKYVGDAEADATTSIPKNWTSDVSAVGNAVWKALCEETKYKDVMDLNPGKIGDILSNVDQSKFASVYQDIATVLPSASGKFVDVNMKTTWSNTYKSYVSNIAVPVDSTKKVEYIKFDSNLVRPNEAILGGGGFNQLGDYNTDLGMLMLSYNGSNTITKDGVEYVMFAKLKRQCADTILFGATLTNAKTTLDHIADLNAELEAIDVETITLEECEALRAKIAELKAVSSYITDADFNTEKLEAAEEAFKADRLSKTVYAPIEMDMPNDYFATRAERGGSSDTFWFDGTKPYNAYLGYLGINDKLPMTRIKYSNGNVISVDGKADTALNKIATLKDGRYVLPMGEVPYRLGEITENVLDGNAFEPGLQILKSDTNLLNSKIDDRYTTSLSSDTSYYTVQAGKFPVTVPNANKVNVLTTSMTNGTTSGPFGLYTVNALVHLDDGTYVGYILLTAPGCTNKAGRNINQSVLFVPKNSGLTTYADIKAAVGGEVKTLEDMTKYHYSDVKLPGASAVQGSSISRYHNVGLTDTRQVDRKFYYDNLIMPEETKMIYRDFGYTVDGFVSSFEIEAPAGRTITAVEFIHDGGSTLRDGYAPAVNALADGSGSTASMFLVPSTLAGVEDYDVYVAITRNCRYSAILGMTAEATGAEAVAGLNTLMANAKTSADIEAVEALKAYIDGENVLESDLDAKSVAAYETAKQNINVEGTIEVSFEEGALASALVTINNITKLAGKPYKVILAYYNEDESQLLGTKVVSGLSTTDAKATFTVDGDNMPGGTKVVKGFLWKDFTTLVPLTPVSK